MMQNDWCINVIYQFNDKYVPYAGVSIESLLANNTEAEAVNIYVLGEDLSDESVAVLKEEVAKYDRNIEFPDTTALIEKFKSYGMIPYRGAYSVYLRLFFTELLDLAGQRAIYLDADTIVDGSLLPLVNCDLSGKSVGMVLESIRDDYKVMIGMSPSADYYNSGMILFDVDKWRLNKYCDRIVDHILNVRSSYIGDQDFLNIICEGDVARLPLIYNFQPLHGRYTADEYFKAYGNEGYYDVDEVSAGPSEVAIYHCYRWLGEFPWNAGNLHPFADKFDKYMMQSVWKGYVKEKASAGAAVRIEKILYRMLPKSMFIKIFKKMHEVVLARAEKDARMQKANTNA